MRETTRRLASRLREGVPPPPPEGLLERIKAEIPESLTCREESGAPEEKASSALTRAARDVVIRYGRIAASLFIVAGAFWLAKRMVSRKEPFPKVTAEDATRPRMPAITAPPTVLSPPSFEGERGRETALAPAVSAGPKVIVSEKANGRKAAAVPTALPQANRVGGVNGATAGSPSPASSAFLDASGKIVLRSPAASPLPTTSTRQSLVQAQASSFYYSQSTVPSRAEGDSYLGAKVIDISGRAHPASPADRQRAASSAGDSPPATSGLATPRHSASTGGTAEPNDLPYGHVFFKTYGVNPFIDTDDEKLSTFGLEVDTGSYTVARRYLKDGHLPPPEAIRVEEFLNYFRYGDKPPGSGDFALTAEGAPSPFALGPRYRILRFGVRARTVEAAHRKSAILTFVVDVSGSMAMENRLALVKRALFLLLDQLRPDDKVGLVVFGSDGRVLLEPTGDRESIRSAIDRLSPEGSTNAEAGLVLGYDLARKYFREDGINRIVLCSDGVANVGRTGADSILERIGESARQGIELTTVGFGMGNFNDVLMEQLADKGHGRYAYVDTLDEARRIFVESLTGTLQTVAADAKAQVEFNTNAVARFRLVGYENRAIPNERFRDDKVRAGQIGAGHTVTVLYEIKLQPVVPPGETVATLRMRYKSVDEEHAVRELAQPLRAGALAASWETASPALRLSSAVA